MFIVPLFHLQIPQTTIVLLLPHLRISVSAVDLTITVTSTAPFREVRLKLVLPSGRESEGKRHISIIQRKSKYTSRKSNGSG